MVKIREGSPFEIIDDVPLKIEIEYDDETYTIDSPSECAKWINRINLMMAMQYIFGIEEIDFDWKIAAKQANNVKKT